MAKSTYTEWYKVTVLKSSTALVSKTFFFFHSIITVVIYSCSIVGKSLCYHASNLGSIPHGSHTTRSPSSRCQANSIFHPSEVGKWVPVNTGAKLWVINDEGYSHRPQLAVRPMAKYLRSQVRRSQHVN